MANTDFLPKREADLLAWANNFSTKLSLDPTSYGVTIVQAGAFETLFDNFQSAFTTASNPGTNSHANIVAKNVAKQALIENARLLAREIQGTPTVTDFQKADIGLTVRDPEPTPVPVPAFPPDVSVLSLFGRTARLRLRDVQNPDRRGKPDGVSGATIFYHVGETAPVIPNEWALLMQTTRTLVDVDFPQTIEPGARVWLTAYWYNTKAESSTAAEPVSLRVGDILTQAA